MKNINCKTKKCCFLLALFLTPFILTAQSNLFVKKSHVYYSITTKNISPKGGTNEIIQIDSGNAAASKPEAALTEKDTSILIYIEASTKKIKWSTAQQGAYTFSITPVLMQSPLQPGFVNGGGIITISAAKACFLYKLELVKNPQQKIKAKRVLTTPFVLKGIFAGKPFMIKTAVPKEIIVTPPA